jgi:hypothetical protein
MSREGQAALGRLRAICSAFPEVIERPSHGAPTWFVRGKRGFATFWPDGHHDLAFPHLWCAAPAGAQADLVRADPRRFFRPPYVGHRGWLGIRMDGGVDWAEVAGWCEGAYRQVAPAPLVARLSETSRRR